jgi:hypothetical protein
MRILHDFRLWGQGLNWVDSVGPEFYNSVDFHQIHTNLSKFDPKFAEFLNDG